MWYHSNHLIQAVLDLSPKAIFRFERLTQCLSQNILGQFAGSRERAAATAVLGPILRVQVVISRPGQLGLLFGPAMSSPPELERCIRRPWMLGR
jgi:hypothetical protein